MELLMQSFVRALRSLLAPGMFGILILSILITIVSLVMFVMGSTTIASWWFHDSGTDTNELAVLGVFGASSLIAWFLFPGIMPVIVNFFDVRIASLIEKQDYPAAMPLVSPPFWPELWHDVRFSTLAIVLNILLLPLYLVPLINIAVFYLLNGYLLGGEFFVMAARRHLPLEDAKALRKKHARLVFAAGVALTFCATVPFANLLAPFWGIAVMTHIFHGVKTAPKAEVLLP